MSQKDCLSYVRRVTNNADQYECSMKVDDNGICMMYVNKAFSNILSGYLFQIGPKIKQISKPALSLQRKVKNISIYV